jgi:penicillin-binding protein 2
MYATRLKAVLVVIGLLFLLVLASLLRIQVLEGGRYRQEAEQRLRRPPGFRPTLRGTVYDRHGVALARDTGAFDVAVYFPFIEMSESFVKRLARTWRTEPDEVRRRVAEMWAELARLTEIPPEELNRRAETVRQRVEVIRQSVREVHGRRIRVREETYGHRSSIPHAIVHDVDLKTVGAVKSRPDTFPGMTLLPTRKREYPHGARAPHVIGRTGEVTAEELADSGGINAHYPKGYLKRYWPGDLIGRGGVEGACEDRLRGLRGMYQKGIEGNFLEDIDAVPGRDVHLTLDIALQGDVEDLFDSASRRRRCGAVVVIDCRTGEVLVLVSAPRYDVRLFQVDFPDLVRRTDRPLVHRAVAGAYPLGSVFKAVTATAALHEGAITPRTFLTCDGILDPAHPERFRCHIFLSHGYGHGTIPLRTAIQKSCNVYFYQVAQLLSRDARGQMDLRLGRARLQDWAERLGLGRPTGCGLPGEAAGRIDVNDPRNLAVGQGKLQVTPLQAAQLYGRVATDGRMPPLRIIREKAPAPDEVRPGLNLNHHYMTALRDAFAAVVNEPGGTGYGRVTLPDVRIAGKTGTAQAGAGDDHAWFVGFAPVDRPRVAFSVIVEHGGHGGETAGPIAREVVKACKAHGYLDEEGSAAPATGDPPADPPAPRPDPPVAEPLVPVG